MHALASVMTRKGGVFLSLLLVALLVEAVGSPAATAINTTTTTTTTAAAPSSRAGIHNHTQGEMDTQPCHHGTIAKRLAARQPLSVYVAGEG